MRNLRWFGGAVALVLLVAACGINGVNGSGKVVTESKNVSGFSSVELTGRGHLIVNQNGRESLTITTDDNLMPYLTSEVSNGVLILGTKSDVNLNPSEDIVYKLTVKNLNKIAIFGAASVDVVGIDTRALSVDISGASKITIAGRADREDVSISGACDYQGQNLKAKVASVDISGVGRAELAVSDTLNAFVSGSGLIRYIGTPTVTQSISGLGSVQKM